MTDNNNGKAPPGKSFLTYKPSVYEVIDDLLKNDPKVSTPVLRDLIKESLGVAVNMTTLFGVRKRFFERGTSMPLQYRHSTTYQGEPETESHTDGPIKSETSSEEKNTIVIDPEHLEETLRVAFNNSARVPVLEGEICKLKELLRQRNLDLERVKADLAKEHDAKIRLVVDKQKGEGVFARKE